MVISIITINNMAIDLSQTDANPTDAQKCVNLFASD